MDLSLLRVNEVNPELPEIAPGDTVQVSFRIVEGNRVRAQAFTGVVIKVRKGVDGGSFTVRSIRYGVGVERTFPFASPRLEKVEVLKHAKVRRARLYYLRGRSGRAARLKDKYVTSEAE